MPRLEPRRFSSRRPAVVGARALVSACAMIAVGSACATVEPATRVDPGVAFSLPVGKTAVVNGSGSQITFNKVREDSRCPSDVTCVWAGDARIELTIAKGGSPHDTKILSLTSPNNEVSSGDLRIRFAGLAPAPRQSDGNKRGYVAQLVVNGT